MDFRTAIQPLKGAEPIHHDTRVVMIGSCFTDNIGARLAEDGFSVSVNAMGALYNPLSMQRAVTRALAGEPYTEADLVRDAAGVWHCLDFESRRQHTDPAALLETLNTDFAAFGQQLRQADVWIVTFGTAWVFERAGQVVGNCHKLPSSEFVRRRLTVEEISNAWKPLVQGRRIIFTVSPIRHLADGLHGNTVSKATLHLAVEGLAEYFPAFEIMMDDLRDYRFYDRDMKHPSAVAVDYIYDIFGQSYFSGATRQRALECRKEARRAAHRPIITCT